MKKLSYLLSTLIPLLALTASLAAAEIPVPKNTGDPTTLGANIQRAMTLLATSTPEHRNTVKVLFYGQSITEQDWWVEVSDDLLRRFPNANLIIENRALGGFSSQRLVKTSETDLYSFYPDLLIFYVFGAHDQYENIIRRTRERTTADIVIQTDHVTKDEQQTEETDPAKIQISGKVWNSFMNYKFLPDLARRYDTGVIDQRNLWKQYLKDNSISAPKLLRDGVHLNADGCHLMAQFVSAYLIKRDDVKIDPYNCSTVKTTSVGSPELKTADRTATFEFTGNRIDAIFGDIPENSQGPANTILIDGKKLSEIPELFGFSRAVPKPGGKWPPIQAITFNTLLIPEEWTVKAKKDPMDAKVYLFSVTGSKTGPDGEGRSDQKFVSNSGRIVIDPSCWDVDYAMSLAGIKPAPDEFTVTWKAVEHFKDNFAVSMLKDRSLENVLTLAQGLKNGPHKIEIKGPQIPFLKALRVYTPPNPDTEKH